jgi:hypothetical protein
VIKRKKHPDVDRLRPELVARSPLPALAALSAERPALLLAQARAALELLELRLPWIGGAAS